jgi:hypothetical protein
MNFSNNWFECSELKANINCFLNKTAKNKILEIGCYEGSFSSFISNNYLDTEGSILYCIDPFDINDKNSPVYGNIKDIFLKNIKNTKNWNKIRLRHCYSDYFFNENKNKVNKQTFNFIYIDGSHEINNIILDFTESLNILEENGILWMDDYLGGDNSHIQNCIDDLYEKNKDKLNIIHKGYQIAFRKI